MNDNISPIRKKYDLFLLIFMGLVLLGAIPFGACDKLEGGFLVYFIVYIALTVGTIITISALFPYVRKKEIEFLKNKFNIENMNKSISFDFKENDFIDDGAYLACKIIVEMVNAKEKNKNLSDIIENLTFT